MLRWPERRRRGCLGCALSHLLLLRQLLREAEARGGGAPRLLLVLEDDVRFRTPFREVLARVTALAERLPFAWEGIRLDCSPVSHKDLVAVVDGAPLYHVRACRRRRGRLEEAPVEEAPWPCC